MNQLIINGGDNDHHPINHFNNDLNISFNVLAT